MLRKGMFLADRYEIIEQIGTGGMSDVYKAKCHKLNRYVAIKVMKAEFSQDKNFVSKFIIEAQSAAGLTHPNVVSVYDVGDEDGIYYIVMELVEGITLKKYIEKKGSLTSKEAVSIAIQVAQGMEAAHSHHIVHRDIKPQNIIISKEGKVKVTDFGIARAASSQTISSSAMGSVHYISPEQARGGYSDEKSDIYSFGITLYEMLTGTVPFDGDSTVSVAVQHIQDEILPPSRMVDGIPISVDQIVMKCTQKKTERRYQSATELIADLKKSLVMPDVNFVQMAPTYDMPEDDALLDDVSASTGSNAKNRASAGKANAGRNASQNRAAEEDDFDDIEDIDDFDNIDDYDDYEAPKRGRNDDDDNEAGEKMDAVMKWVGLGIAALIIIITIFIVVKLMDVIGAASGTSDGGQVTQKAEVTTVDPATLVTVPSVTGLTEDAAKKALNAVNLGCKVSRQPSDTVAEGYVISQSQKENTKIAKNSTVTISVSSGSNATSMVNVVGKAEDEAVSAITGAGFASPVIDYDYSDKVEQGYVISQSPAANASVKSGDTIKIVVSRGKESKMVKVPNVVNMSENQARQTLDALGLNVVLSKTQVMSDKIPYGYVAAQNYSEGKEVAEGTTIELTMSIGLGVPTVTLPQTATPQTTVPAVTGN
ncbi:MAG: Stk1 family PASTA domain-containing Ser/Thr kinase [Clostridia bacterium]|nr:Stk1 family PASTA domain-containing Ser/Thr kinase [Clostridia bacterium]